MTTQPVITTVVFAGYNCMKKTEDGKSMPFAFLEFGDEDREILVHGEILSDLKAGSTVKAELSDVKKLEAPYWGRHYKKHRNCVSPRIIPITRKGRCIITAPITTKGDFTMSFEQYFTDSQHRFMAAVTETLIACRWEDDEAFQIASDVLTDWEYTLHDDLDAMKKEQSEITKDWAYYHKSDNTDDTVEANRLYTKSNVLSSDIRYLEGLIHSS